MRTIKGMVVGTEVLGHAALTSQGVVEDLARGHAVDGTGLQAKPNDPPRVPIHDEQDPGRPQHDRFTLKPVYTPETVLQVSEESAPRWTPTAWLGSVMSGQYAANDLLIDGDSEGQAICWAIGGQAQEG